MKVIVDLTGDYGTNIFDAARWLLENGLAEPSDLIETERNGQSSMCGQVGVFANAKLNGVNWPKGLELKVAKAAEPLDGQVNRVKGPKSGGAKPSTQRGSPGLELIDDFDGAETRPAYKEIVARRV
jgi:hypothetical protein